MDNQLWRLCSLLSPNEDEIVLLTFRNGTELLVGEATYRNNTYLYIAETETEYYESAYGIPVAWMAMPLPYNSEKVC